MIVTAEAGGVPMLSGHTNNVYNKSLHKILAENQGAWFYAHRT